MKSVQFPSPFRLPSFVKMEDLNNDIVFADDDEENELRALSPHSIHSSSATSTSVADNVAPPPTDVSMTRRQADSATMNASAMMLGTLPTYPQLMYNHDTATTTTTTTTTTMIPSALLPSMHVNSFVTTDIYLRAMNGDSLSDVYYPKNPTFEEHIRAINEQYGPMPQHAGSMIMLNSPFVERERRPPGTLPYVPPPRETFAEADENVRPRRQDEKLRYVGDLYTPRWVRGHGTQREGWCSLCEEGTWMQLKTSQYWYHVRFTHGVNSNTGRIYDPPVQLRVYDDTFGSTFGLCGECQTWIPICTPRRRRSFTSWFKHAHKCHRGRSCGAGGGALYAASNFLLDSAAFDMASAATFMSTNVPRSVEATCFSPLSTTATVSTSDTSSPSYDAYNAYDAATAAAAAAAQAHPHRFSWPVSLNPSLALSGVGNPSGSSFTTFNATSNLTAQALQAAYASVQGGGGSGGLGQSGAPLSLHRRSASGPYV